MNLNKLAEEAYAIARKNGWHGEEHSDEHWLMLVLTEIAEAVQADRKGKHADVSKFKEYQTYYGTFLPSEEIREIRFKEDFEEYIKNSVEDELADIVIRCLDLAGLRVIDFHYAEILLSKGIREVQISFPELMFQACEEITYHGYDLSEKLNAIVAGIIAYCTQKGIEIELFIEQKMKYNRLRPFKHGGLKY